LKNRCRALEFSSERPFAACFVVSEDFQRGPEIFDDFSEEATESKARNA
jgi:hypothetical protein